jgi:RecJ-like exonuclease
VFAFFAIALIVTYVLTGDTRILLWGVPTVILLLVLPLGLNYLSMKEYAELKPAYREQAITVRVRLINEGMIGKIVRIEGVVESVRFKFINRPQYIVADRSGEISVKMFTSANEDVEVNDVVEVIGQVIRRYVVTGDPILNCVSISKIDKNIERKPKPDPESKKKPAGKNT